MAHIMTTKEMSQYLKLHEITLCECTSQGLIPSTRIGRIRRFDKVVVKDWIRTDQNERKGGGRFEGENPMGVALLRRPRQTF